MNLLLSTRALAGIIVGVVIVVLLLAIAIWWITTHNKLVRMKNQYEEAFHNIDIYLKKRYDLIPNLVETVKGYAKHESGTLTAVIEARAKAQSATTTEEKIEANAQLTQQLKNFNLLVERYPELKANSNFLELQATLKNIELELAQSRKYYNATIKQFNSAIQVFPSSIVARKMRCEKQPYFELDSIEERQNVKVSF